MGHFGSAITKTEFFWENLEVSKIWNKNNPDTVRNLHENYRNCLLEKKHKGVTTC